MLLKSNFGAPLLGLPKCMYVLFYTMNNARFDWFSGVCD